MYRQDNRMTGFGAGCKRNEFKKFFFRSAVYVALALLLTVLQNRAEVSAAVQDGMPLLCREDQVVVIPKQNNEFSIYDCRGNQIGEWRSYGDIFSAAVLDRDTVMAYNRDDVKEVFSFRTLDVLMSFPTADYLVTAMGKNVLAVNKNSGDIYFYDSAGTLLYEGTGPVTEVEWGLTTRFIRLEKGCLIYSGTVEEVKAVYIGDDGTIKELSSDTIKKAVENGYIQAFGENLFIRLYDEETSFISDLDGVHLLDDLEDCLYPRRTMAMDYYDSFSWYFNSPDLVMKETDGMYVLYDKSLSLIGQVPADPEDEYFRPETSGGYVVGLPYHELLGRTCDGFAECGDGLYPYTQMNNGCLVFYDDKVIALPVPADETLVSFSDAYFVTTRMDETVTDDYGGFTTTESAWKRDDGELFIQGGQDGSSFFLFLNETGLSVYCYGVPDEFSSTQFMYNNQYELAFPPVENIYIRSFKNGYWYTNRSVYSGIIDTEGNWVVREIVWDE